MGCIPDLCQNVQIQAKVFNYILELSRGEFRKQAVENRKYNKGQRGDKYFVQEMNCLQTMDWC